MSSSPESPPSRPLREVVAAPAYLDAIRDVALRMVAAANMAELLRLLTQGIKGLGARHGYFATYVRDDHGFGPCRTLLACDPEWALEYERDGHFAADPWLDYAATHSAPTLSSDIAVAAGAESATVDLARRFGFQSVVIVPTPAGGGSNRVGALVTGSPQRGYFEDAGYAAFRLAARVLAMELSESSRRVARSELIAANGLTHDELMLLQQARRGLSSKDLALRTGLSDQAVDCRFKRLLPKFRVHSRAEAVRLAADHGLI